MSRVACRVVCGAHLEVGEEDLVAAIGLLGQDVGRREELHGVPQRRPLGNARQMGQRRLLHVEPLRVRPDRDDLHLRACACACACAVRCACCVASVVEGRVALCGRGGAPCRWPCRAGCG